MEYAMPTDTPTPACGRAMRKASAGALLFCALALLLSLCALPDDLAAKPAATAVKAPAKPIAKVDPTPADEPVQRFQVQLARKSATPATLKKLEDDLEAARAAKPDGPQGAKATFFLARVQEELARRGGARAEWLKCEETFGQYLERFPKHALAADALVKRGSIRLRMLRDADGAQADFQAVLKNHPAHRLAPTARSLAAQAQKAAKSGMKRDGKADGKADARADVKAEGKGAVALPAPANLPPPPSQSQKPRGSGMATLVESRYKTGSDYTRVVLDVDMPVRFKYQLLDSHGSPVSSPSASGGKDNKPALLYIDLMHTQVARSIPGEVRVSGGILNTLRTRQYDADTARIVLDFKEMHDYKVFALENPFRLVVDVYATDTPKSAAKGPGKAAPPPSAYDMPEEPDPPAPKSVVKGGISAPKGSRKRMATDLIEQLGLTVRTIMIDAGHGGKDPGAQGHGLMEKDVNLRMALILGKVLKAEGFNVVYTRTTDVFLPLEERTARANVRKVDLFISLHCNAHADPTMSGLETYSLNLAKTPDAVRVAARENAVSDKSISDLQMILTDLMLNSKIKESLDLARGVQKSGLTTLRGGKFTVNDHGNREAPFYVLMGAKMPSVLVEIGYITNKVEAGRLKNDYYLRTMARGIADGVVRYKAQIERYAGKN